MKLLFDENLSPRLPGLVSDLYPGSVHVEQVGMKGLDDFEIWRFALKNGYVVVSKDDDFRDLALLQPPPHKAIVLNLGNCTTIQIEGLLRRNFELITEFELASEASLLELP